MNKTSFRILAVTAVTLMLGMTSQVALCADTPAANTNSTTTPTVLKPVDVVAKVPAKHPRRSDNTTLTAGSQIPGTTVPFPVQGDPQATARAQYHSTAAYHDGPWSSAAQAK